MKPIFFQLLVGGTNFGSIGTLAWRSACRPEDAANLSGHSVEILEFEASSRRTCFLNNVEAKISSSSEIVTPKQSASDHLCLRLYGKCLWSLFRSPTIGAGPLEQTHV